MFPEIAYAVSGLDSGYLAKVSRAAFLIGRVVDVNCSK
jgi:hypothetical protein